MRRVALAALLAFTVAPASARADQSLAELGRDAPVAGYGGWKAWSQFDAKTARYTLMFGHPDDSVGVSPLPPSPTPWDVSLGPDADGGVVAIYRSCGSRGCDLRRLEVSAFNGRDEPLPSVSSPHYSEATPTIWRSTVVFTRRIRGCDVPYVKNLASHAPSRRLLRSRCLQTPAGHVSIRGTRIAISSVDRSGADEHGAGRKVSEIRRYDADRRGSKVLLRQTFGEESNLFGQVAQDASRLYSVRFGTHQPNTLVRVSAGGTRRQEVAAFRRLTGGFAKPSDRESLYVEQQGIETECDGFVQVPCRVALATAVPFGGVRRRLTPELTVSYEGEPRRGQPLTFTGQLVRRVVASNSLVRVEPRAGYPIELYHRNRDETFAPTGLTARTDADGRYRIVVPAVGDDPWYTAVAFTPPVATWAGRGTVGSVTR